jgi:ArsR family transcriptional regulator, virulence genes transcriptional regulator
MPTRKSLTVRRSAKPESAIQEKRASRMAARRNRPPDPAEHGGKEDYASTARLFRALSHPLRVQLVCGLLQEPLNQTAIARVLGLSQSLVAQHLAILRRCGLVRGRRSKGEVLLEVSDARIPGIFQAVCHDAGRFLTAGWDGIARHRRMHSETGADD